MNERREELLQAFGLAATTRPLNREALATARKQVEEELGREVLVETAATIGTFECFTKFVDATGKVPNPAFMLSIMSVVLGSINWVYGMFW
jgi:hypothetical protein